MRRYLTRFLLYGLGFFIFSVGSALAIKSTLGVTATTSLPLALSRVTGFTVGAMMTAMSLLYVAAQAVLLRRKFQLVNLGQILCGLMMGGFVDLASNAMAGFSPETYLMKLALMLLSLPLIALGLSLIVNMNLLPSPAEGFVLAISQVSGKPFPKLKVLVDCITLGAAFLLLVTTSHGIENFREGTVLDAVLIGVLIGVWGRVLAPLYAAVNDGAYTERRVEKENAPSGDVCAVE